MKYAFILFNVVVLCFSNVCEAQKTIAIATYKCYGAPPWDPESIKSGITGSEEAVIYVSRELAEIGYRVLILGDPPKNSRHSQPGANPRYVDVDFNDGTRFDIAISWRMPEAAERLKKRADRVYFWPHDTYDSPLTSPQIDAFDGVLWLSKWQREYWIWRNPGFAKFTTVFGNGIVPEQFQDVQERENSFSCIYGSNYARGLDILLNCWPSIKQQFPKATLDIYYGWQHWGLLAPAKEAAMRAQVILLGPLGVKEHGLVSHEELNQAYSRASFWTYPCTAPETFCITALRAQLSGAIPVIIEGTALKETVRWGYKCAKPEDYPQTLFKAMERAEAATLEERRKMGEFIISEYSWKKIAEGWNRFFEEISNQNSRKEDGAGV